MMATRLEVSTVCDAMVIAVMVWVIGCVQVLCASRNEADVFQLLAYLKYLYHSTYPIVSIIHSSLERIFRRAGTAIDIPGSELTLSGNLGHVTVGLALVSRHKGIRRRQCPDADEASDAE